MFKFLKVSIILAICLYTASGASWRSFPEVNVGVQDKIECNIAAQLLMTQLAEVNGRNDPSVNQLSLIVNSILNAFSVSPSQLYTDWEIDLALQAGGIAGVQTSGDVVKKSIVVFRTIENELSHVNGTAALELKEAAGHAALQYEIHAQKIRASLRELRVQAESRVTMSIQNVRDALKIAPLNNKIQLESLVDILESENVRESMVEIARQAIVTEQKLETTPIQLVFGFSQGYLKQFVNKPKPKTDKILETQGGKKDNFFDNFVGKWLGWL